MWFALAKKLQLMRQLNSKYNYFCLFRFRCPFFTFFLLLPLLSSPSGSENRFKSRYRRKDRTMFSELSWKGFSTYAQNVFSIILIIIHICITSTEKIIYIINPKSFWIRLFKVPVLILLDLFLLLHFSTGIKESVPQPTEQDDERANKMLCAACNSYVVLSDSET